MITLGELIDDAEVEAGATTDPRLDPERIVNEAGRHLFAMHSWRWRQRPPASLAFVEEQEFVDLPSDFGFGDVDDIAMADTIAFSIEPISLAEMQQWREQSLGSPGFRFYYALSYPGQNTTLDAAGNARLEIYPTPTSDVPEAMTVIYRAGWVQLADSDSAANVHPLFEHLLRMLVRAFMFEHLTGSAKRIDAIETSIELRKLKRADAAAQPNLGTMQGGQLQPDKRRGYEWFYQTVGPGE